MDVIMLSQENETEKWASVRIPTELLEAAEDFAKNSKDEFGLQKYGTKSEVVAEAVKEFLREHAKKGVQ